MRDLNECTAEVFRRGEQRIRERRRKRSRVLALCIPVCLIAAVWSVMNLPVRTPAGETSCHVQAEAESIGHAPGTNACPYAAAEIKAPDHCEEVTDRVAVAYMFYSIDSYLSEADGSFHNVNENLPAEDTVLAESTGKAEGYTITFTDDDGWQAAYRLIGNMLVDVSTDETVFLSDFEVYSLMDILGLTE